MVGTWKGRADKSEPPDETIAQVTNVVTMPAPATFKTVSEQVLTSGEKRRVETVIVCDGREHQSQNTNVEGNDGNLRSEDGQLQHQARRQSDHGSQARVLRRRKDDDIPPPPVGPQHRRVDRRRARLGAPVKRSGANPKVRAATSKPDGNSRRLPRPYCAPCRGRCSSRPRRRSSSGPAS